MKQGDNDMDELSERLLKLATDPNASMEDLITGMNALSARIDAENRAHRRQQAQAHHATVQAATGDDLRKLASQNLARLRKR